MAMLCHRSNDHGFSLLSPLVYLLPERFHLISTGIREPLSLTVSLLILHVLREQRVRSVCRSFHLSLSLSLSLSLPRIGVIRSLSFSLFHSLSFFSVFSLFPSSLSLPLSFFYIPRSLFLSGFSQSSLSLSLSLSRSHRGSSQYCNAKHNACTRRDTTR